MKALAILPALCALLAIACGGASSPATNESTSPRGDVTVFAAASLTDAFQEIARGYESQYPGTRVVFNFAGTPTLRTQLEQGARADVFASANLEQMDLARKSGVVEASATTFARNSLVVITPASNPGNVVSPQDLARRGLKLVIAQENVPVGDYTRQALAAMAKDPAFGADFADRVLANARSLESNVKQVVAKVELGEADAGIVYGTDVTPAVAPSLHKLEIADRYNVIAEYPMSLVKDRGNDVAGRAFIDYVMSQKGQEVLKKYGFLSAG